MTARTLPAGVDFDHAVNLMTALIVFKRKRLAVFAPHRVGYLVWIREQRVVDVDLFTSRYVKQDRLFKVEHVARLCINDRGKLRLYLIFRRRLDVAHLALVTWTNTIGTRSLSSQVTRRSSARCSNSLPIRLC